MPPPKPGETAIEPKEEELIKTAADLSQDIAERQNLQAQHPEVVAQLTRLLQKYIDEGRSTPGKPQPNTGAVELRPENRKKASSKPANAKGSGAKAAGQSSE